jgi:starvation-inducible outer membrane lipoprotein
MKMFKVMILIITISFILAACGTAAQTPTETQIPPPTYTHPGSRGYIRTRGRWDEDGLRSSWRIHDGCPFQ